MIAPQASRHRLELLGRLIDPRLETDHVRIPEARWRVADDRTVGHLAHFIAPAVVKYVFVEMERKDLALRYRVRLGDEQQASLGSGRERAVEAVFLAQPRNATPGQRPQPAAGLIDDFGWLHLDV